MRLHEREDGEALGDPRPRSQRARGSFPPARLGLGGLEVGGVPDPASSFPIRLGWRDWGRGGWRSSQVDWPLPGAAGRPCGEILIYDVVPRASSPGASEMARRRHPAIEGRKTAAVDPSLADPREAVSFARRDAGTRPGAWRRGRPGSTHTGSHMETPFMHLAYRQHDGRQDWFQGTRVEALHDRRSWGLADRAGLVDGDHAQIFTISCSIARRSA